MKKYFKRVKEYLKPVDKVFLIGFTALTIATFDLNSHWIIVTLIGYSLIAWQYGGNHAKGR